MKYKSDYITLVPIALQMLSAHYIVANSNHSNKNQLLRDESYVDN